MIFAEPLLKALDEDKDSTVTREEFTQGLGRLFEAWNTDKSGSLTEQQLRSGIEKDLSPPRGRFPQQSAAAGSAMPTPWRNTGMDRRTRSPAARSGRQRQQQR